MRFVAIRDLYLLLVLALIKVLSWSPSYRLRELCVSGVAFIAYHLSGSKKRQMANNLSRTMGTAVSLERRQRIVQRAFYEYWKNIFSILPSRAEAEVLEGVEIQGIEHLQRALENGKGVILWESQFGAKTLAPRILHEKGLSVHEVHAESHLWGLNSYPPSMSWVTRHVIRAAFERWEKRSVAEIIYLPKSDSLAFTRTLLKRLKQNGILSITGDGKFGRNLIPLRFLGWTDFFSPGMVSLAKTSGAPILPMFCYQDRNDDTNLIIESPIRIDTSLGREQGLESSLEQYVSLFESYVTRYPEKYLYWDVPEKARYWFGRGRGYENHESEPGR
jgi:lauroyl/myristoyl acyltransferase